MWHIWQTTPNNGWSRWDPLGKPASGLSDLVVAQDRIGRLVLFARYRMADERRRSGCWSRPTRMTTGRGGRWASSRSFPRLDQIGVPVLAKDGESRQLLAYPVAMELGGAYRFQLTGTGTSAPLSRSGSWAAFVTAWSR